MAYSTAAQHPAAFTSFGELLRYLRRRQHLTQIELAIAVGYSTAQISRLEQNQRLPNPSTLEALFVPALGLEHEPDMAARLLELARAARGSLDADQLDLPPPPTTSAPASAWPGGTTTFLFTDIEGSTQLWEQHPQAMSAALQRHEILLRQAIVSHHGVVFKTVGDGVCAAFASALDALAAAFASQRALVAEAWDATGLPAGQPLRVRMALHTGAAETRAGDYVGPPLNRVARLLAAAHGGQILLSRASAELVADGLPTGVTVQDLGTHQLTGLRRPEQIFQLVGPQLPSEFPPLRTLASSSANPPAPAIPLLTTKLYVPPARPNLVPRPRLIERLQAGITGKLTLLTAPAGFGKTTLVSEWLQEKAKGKRQEAKETDDDASFLPPSFYLLPFKVAWVSLDGGDNDPTRFWSYVCAALETLLPGVAAPTLALLQLPQPPPAEALLPSLLNAVSARAANCVLVLDDYHVIDAPAIHAALTFLLSHLPPRLHLVIASRTDPPLPLPRLRARGELTELRAAELRFTTEEAASFLTEVMGSPLSPEDVAALETRTEGWIAGLQLAALSMRDRRDRAGFISAFTGSQRFVGEYLADEVFARQPSHIQTFLLRTSILSRMCGPLCDAVMLGGAGGAAAHTHHPAAPDDSFSQVLLEYLERANLFVVPLDDARQWYRYHHLFGEMLREQLVHGTTREAVATLHRRASAWYEQQGLIAEAVQHALAAQDWEQALRMIEEHGLRLMLRGQVHTGLGWLNALPEAFIQRHPLLCIVHAIGLMLSNQADAAEVRLQDAERSLPPDTPDELVRVVRGSVAGVRGRILYLAGDLARAIGSLQQALALLPETTTSVAAEITSAMARAAWAVYIATAYRVTGDVTAASERRAAEAIAPVRALGHMMATLNGYTSLATLQVLQGRLHTAAATYTEVERLVPGQDALQALSGSPSYYFGMGDLLREWNDLDAAEAYLARGMDLIQGTLATEADVIVRGYLTLARVQQARGDGAAAIATLETFVRLARERQLFPLLIEPAAALQARIRLQQGDLGAALRWAEGSCLSPGDAISFPREAAHLTLARLRIAAGQTEDIAPLLDRLLADAEANARMHSAIEILILQALAYDAFGDRHRALTALDRALVLAAPEGYIRVFIDEGAPLAALLAQSVERKAQNDSIRAYAEHLLSAFPAEQRVGAPDARGSPPVLRSVPERSNALVEPLTERELELLRLTATGRSNKQIAVALIVSVGTVKKHLNNIFGKLGVQSRIQAVERARALRLL
jgi:LuxR family maltose regulon positive regulatory protein